MKIERKYGFRELNQELEKTMKIGDKYTKKKLIKIPFKIE